MFKVLVICMLAATRCGGSLTHQENEPTFPISFAEQILNVATTESNDEKVDHKTPYKAAAEKKSDVETEDSDVVLQNVDRNQNKNLAVWLLNKFKATSTAATTTSSTTTTSTTTTTLPTGPGIEYDSIDYIE